VTADKDVSARAVSDVECAVVAELVVRIRDRGPEPDWHTNRSLFGAPVGLGVKFTAAGR
jgi:hypothetical protein